MSTLSEMLIWDSFRLLEDAKSYDGHRAREGLLLGSPKHVRRRRQFPAKCAHLTPEPVINTVTEWELANRSYAFSLALQSAIREK